jgi:hypothetical protein
MSRNARRQRLADANYQTAFWTCGGSGLPLVAPLELAGA